MTEGATPSFYSIDTTVPSTAVLMGTSERLRNAVGLAADDTFVYVAAEHVDTGQEGIYRIARAALATPSTEPVDIAPGVDFLGGSSPSREGALYVDQPVAPTALYFRNAQGHVEAVLDPGATPLHIGEIIRLGVSADSAMGFDPDTGSLYLFETETESNGHFVRFDR